MQFTQNIIFVLIFAIHMAGCAVAGKNFYFEPTEQEYWNLKIHEPTPVYVPPMSEYKCGDLVVLYRSSPIGEYLYSIGPIIPIIPTFGLLDTQPGEHGFLLFFSIKGLTSDPGINIDHLVLQTKDKIIKPDSISQSKGGGEWLYTFNFKSNLVSVDKFSVILNKEIQNCSLPVLLFSKQHYSFYYPFFIPMWDD